MHANVYSFFLSTAALVFTCSLSVVANADDTSSLVAPCQACHGSDGVSPGGAWPSLAGQKQGYLLRQMKAFRDGDRSEVTMTPFVASLSDEKIEKIAAHYASLARPGKPAADSINQAGANVRANCLSCHGVQGFTVNDIWPNLAGQNKAYLLRQLEVFKDGSRHSPIMNVIANELTEQQMRDVAEYYSQLAY